MHVLEDGIVKMPVLNCNALSGSDSCNRGNLDPNKKNGGT